MNTFCRLLYFLLILKAVVSLEDDPREGKITGGYEAEPHSNPYVVSLQTRNYWRRYRLCTGSILSQRWILSSGHCVIDSWAKGYGLDAIVGAHNLARISYSQIYPISRRIAHPMYRGGVGPYDISMMKTSRDIEYSDKVQPISLPATNPYFMDDEELLITGWGALQSTPSKLVLPNRLQEVEVTYLPFYECYRAIDYIMVKYQSNPLRKRANICTGPIYGGTAGCTGDSGGPLVRYVPKPSVGFSSTSTTTGREETTSSTSSTMTTNRPSTMNTGGTYSSTQMTTDWPTSSTTMMTSTSSTPEFTTETEDNETTSMSSPTMSSPTMSTPTMSIPTVEAASFGANRGRINNSRSMWNKMMPTVVGVISWGVVPCGYKGAPTVYTNVTHYMDFIEEYLYSS